MADDSKQDDNNDLKRRGKHHGKRGSSGGLGGLLGGGIVPVLEKALGSYKHGGRVKKTGAYLVHKGERVIPAGRTKIAGTQIGHALPAKHRSTKTARTKIVASQARK